MLAVGIFSKTTDCLLITLPISAHTPIARHDEAEAIIEASLEHFKDEADGSPACARRLVWFYNALYAHLKTIFSPFKY